MSHDKIHISTYRQHAIVLVSLLFLTFITVFVAEINLGNIAIIVALLVASVKAFIVLTYFMHLKYEKLIFRLLVGMIFLLFAIVLIITFIDYGYRV